MCAEESLLRGVGVDAEIAEQVAAAVQSEPMKAIAAAFAKNVRRVGNTLSMPRATAEFALTFIRFGWAVWQRWQAEPTEQTYDEALKSSILEALSKHEAEVRAIFESVKRDKFPDKVLASLQQVPDAREWIEGQLASAVSGTWTAVECVATDAWVTALNALPMKFYKRVLGRKGTGEALDGLSEKQIAIWLLAKHNFDLRGSLGTLLKPKFDLTSLNTIRIAYEAAFGKCEDLDEIFEDRDLRLLEASRHVIVHRAGIVDEEFVTRTKTMNVGVAEGQMLPISGAWVATLVNAGIRAGSALVRFVDARLVSENTDECS
jgi:hypothetical protein